jgi:hypothetical protein
MTTEEQAKQLQNLSEIRSMMEKSSRFISLSGFSGVFIGLFALTGVGAAWIYMNRYLHIDNYRELLNRWQSLPDQGFYKALSGGYLFFILDVLTVLLFSLTASFLMTWRHSSKTGQKVWDKTAGRLFSNMMIPLAAGGIFTLILLEHGMIALIAPSTLLFYGLALFNASKYTLNEIRYLGICEIILGLAGAMYPGYGLLLWSIGFGVLHIVYGIAMYRKYER